MKQVVPRVFLAAALAGLSAYLLKGDVWTFWTWWMLAFLMGMLAMPVTGRLFAGFEDKGWIFSKVLAIAVTGFLTWLLVAVKLIPFTTVSCIGVSVVCGILCILLYFYQMKKGVDCLPAGRRNLDFQRGNSVFYILSFVDLCSRIPAGGSRNEKFMDYGFMEAMMRSSTLPARDLWYSEGTINYYYGGRILLFFLQAYGK